MPRALVVKKYMKKVKAAAVGGGDNLRGGISIIKPNALLPNEIIKYVQDEDVGEAAEVQWKAMVEEIQQGEGLGKFKNCLVVGYGGLGYKEWSYPEAGWKFWCLK